MEGQDRHTSRSGPPQAVCTLSPSQQKRQAPNYVAATHSENSQNISGITAVFWEHKDTVWYLSAQPCVSTTFSPHYSALVALLKPTDLSNKREVSWCESGISFLLEIWHNSEFIFKEKVNGRRNRIGLVPFQFRNSKADLKLLCYSWIRRGHSLQNIIFSAEIIFIVNNWKWSVSGLEMMTFQYPAVCILRYWLHPLASAFINDRLWCFNTDPVDNIMKATNT